MEAHDWFQRFSLTVCKKCGYVRNATSDQRGCRGPVRVGLRSRINADRFDPSPDDTGLSGKVKT